MQAIGSALLLRTRSRIAPLHTHSFGALPSGLPLLSRCICQSVAGLLSAGTVPVMKGETFSFTEAELQNQAQIGLEPAPAYISAATQVLRAYLRKAKPRYTNRERENNRVPAILSDIEKPRWPVTCKDVYLSLESRAIVRILKTLGRRGFLSRTFDMEIYSPANVTSKVLIERLQVLPRNVNYGPGKTNILNIHFVRAPSDRILKLGVALEFQGLDKCPGIRKGGSLRKLAKHVVYCCKVSELPAKIVVDLSVVEIGNRVIVGDLEIDQDLLDSDISMPVCEIVKDAEKPRGRKDAEKPRGRRDKVHIKSKGRQTKATNHKLNVQDRAHRSVTKCRNKKEKKSQNGRVEVAVGTKNVIGNETRQKRWEKKPVSQQKIWQMKNGKLKIGKSTAVKWET